MITFSLVKTRFNIDNQPKSGNICLPMIFYLVYNPFLTLFIWLNENKKSLFFCWQFLSTIIIRHLLAHALVTNSKTITLCFSRLKTFFFLKFIFVVFFIPCFWKFFLLLSSQFVFIWRKADVQTAAVHASKKSNSRKSDFSHFGTS